MGSHPKGLAKAKGDYAEFNTNHKNNSVINLIVLQVLVFLMNCSPAIANGGRNGINQYTNRLLTHIRLSIYHNFILY